MDRKAVAPAAIDRYRLPAGPTAANPPHAAAASEWDRQTDTVPLHRPCSVSYADSVNNTYNETLIIPVYFDEYSN